MKKNTWSWLFVSTLTLISAAVLGIGFYLALFPSGQDAGVAPVPNATAPVPAPNAADQPNQAEVGTYQLLALGDSLTKGIGDPSGKGYVGYLKDHLAHEEREVVLQNLGVSGLESGELLRSLQGTGVKTMIQEAELIAISIGANDVTHAFGGVEQLISQGIDEKQVVAVKDAYTQNLKDILTLVRGENDTAPILIIGLYNPFEGLFNDQGQSDRLLLEWNDNLRITAQAFPQTKVVPMFDLFQWNNDTLLSVDHFHPNAKGYQQMASRIVQALPQSVLDVK